MEPIFKVGDKVRIVDLQQLKESNVPFKVVSDMLPLSGEFVEIIEVISPGYDISSYKYDGSEFPNYNKPDGYRYCLTSADKDVSLQVCRWKWSSPMLKKASKDSNTSLKIKVTRKPIVLNFKN